MGSLRAVCLAAAVLASAAEEAAQRTCCECIRHGLPEALQPIEGKDTVKGYVLRSDGAVVKAGSRTIVLEGVHPGSSLLGISPANGSGGRQIITGWQEASDIYHLQVFAAKRENSATARATVAVDDARAWVRFFRPPGSRDEPITLIDVVGGATWTTTYRVRPDRIEELFESNVYELIDLDHDGVYEFVAWWNRPLDIRCNFGICGMRVYPRVYAGAGDTYRQVWPAAEWAPYGGDTERAVHEARRGADPGSTMPWGAPLQIMGTFADVDADGAVELVALTDTLTPQQSPQYLAVYKLVKGSMRMVSRAELPASRTAYLLEGERAQDGKPVMVVDMANEVACGGGQMPDDVGSIKAVYEFRAGRFERTATRVNHRLTEGNGAATGGR